MTEPNFTTFTTELAKLFSQYESDGVWMIGQEGDTPTFTQAELQTKVNELLNKYRIVLPRNLYYSVNKIIYETDIPQKESTK